MWLHTSNRSVSWWVYERERERKVLPIKQPFSLLHPVFQTCNPSVWSQCLKSFTTSLLTKMSWDWEIVSLRATNKYVLYYTTLLILNQAKFPVL